jgi:RNA polymerase sigma-70 factor, ECF subfamily
LIFALDFSFFGQPTTTVIVINTDETHLLQRLREGDQDALKVIFLKYHQDLCTVAYRIVNDAQKSKDVVQDVFLKIWLKRSDLRIEISLYAYLKRAVVNTAINTLQHHRVLAIDHEDITTKLTAGPADPSELQEFKELNEQANKAIASLPARTRAVFQLIRLEGMSYREVSEHLSISEKAVEKEMMKALRLLREALKDYLTVLLFLKIFW